MPSKATTVKQYLDELPEDRLKTISAIRRTIKANLDPKFKEGMQYGMIGYSVPHSVYPGGYHCDPKQPVPFASIASQKNHIGIYLFCLYMDEAEQARFVDAWKVTGKKLDMGKSCIRIKKLDDIPLDVLGDAIGRITCNSFIRQYEQQLAAPRLRKKSATKTAAKKSVSKKTSKTKSTSKKPVAKKPVTKKPVTKKKITKKASSRSASGTKKKPVR